MRLFKDDSPKTEAEKAGGRLPGIARAGDRTTFFRANSNFFPTCSTFCRHAPLFSDMLHYFPTQATIFRHAPLFSDKRSLFFRHVPNAPTFATLRNVSFPLADTPPPRPPPMVGAAPRSASPAARPLFLPARQFRKMFYIFRQPFYIFRLPFYIFRQLFYIFRQQFYIFRQQFYIFRQHSIFSDKVYYFPTNVACFPTNVVCRRLTGEWRMKRDCY